MSYGLVFCGGGGRGAYQIGVWKALAELGIAYQIKAVSGSSVGALNAALFVSHTPEAAERIWMSLKQSDIADISSLFRPAPSSDLDKIVEQILKETMPDDCNEMLCDLGYKSPKIATYIKNEGLFSQDGLKRIIKQNHVEAGVKKSRTLCFATRLIANSPNIETEYVPLNHLKNENEIVEALADSSCIPLFFQAQKHDNNRYWDGGTPIFGDNCPIEPLYNPVTYKSKKYSLNLRKFIVVMLDPNAQIDKKRYRDAEFIIIKPKRSIYMGHTGTPAAGDGMMDFNGDNARIRIDLGYNDTIEVFKNLGRETEKKPLSTDKKTAIARIIYKYRFALSDEGKFTFGSSLDNAKVKNAIAHYARKVPQEDVLALFDSTSKGTGKAGFMLTKEAYIVSMFLSNQYIPYSNIAAVEAKGDGEVVIYTKEGGTISTLTSGCNEKKLKELLDEIRRLF